METRADLNKHKYFWENILCTYETKSLLEDDLLSISGVKLTLNFLQITSCQQSNMGGGGGVTVRAALLLQSLSNMTCNYAVGGRKPFIVSN